MRLSLALFKSVQKRKSKVAAGTMRCVDDKDVLGVGSARSPGAFL